MKHKAEVDALKKRMNQNERTADTPEILIYYSDEDRPPETDPETGRRRMLVEYDAAFRGL